jgi:BNR/Asp-box repeat
LSEVVGLPGAAEPGDFISGWRASLRLAPSGRFALALTVAGALTFTGAVVAGATGATAPTATPVQVSHCPTSNANAQDAVDGSDVYVAWAGCGASSGIGFARSTDGGHHFGKTQVLPGSYKKCSSSTHCLFYTWDPSIAVSLNDTVFTSFMEQSGSKTVPVVDVSHNHGRVFEQLSTLPTPQTVGITGWGYHDHIVVSRNGTIYVTWSWAADSKFVTTICASIGSCGVNGGGFDVVVQRSTDGGKTWSKMQSITGSGFSGALDAPVVVQKNGTLDVLYEQFPTPASSTSFGPGGEEFTRSTNGGRTWSTPVAVGASVGTIAAGTWWIDGDLSMDRSGNLYATWDTQSSTSDVGWLSYSKDGGMTWSTPLRVTPGTGTAEELVSSASVGSGIVDVAWQTPTATQGYATYLRPFSIKGGWLTSVPMRVSTAYGSPTIWPGDTLGIVALPTGAHSTHGLPVAISWGSATNGRKMSQIYSTDAAP